MRTTVIATALAVTFGAVRDFALTSSEPVALLFWGGGLLALSIVLRAGFARRFSVPAVLSQRKPLSSATPSLTQPARS